MNARAIRRKFRKAMGMFWISIRLDPSAIDSPYPRTPKELREKRRKHRISSAVTWEDETNPKRMISDKPRCVASATHTDGSNVFWLIHSSDENGDVRYAHDHGFEWLKEYGEIALQKYLWEMRNCIGCGAEFENVTGVSDDGSVTITLGYKERGRSRISNRYPSKIRRMIKKRGGKVRVITFAGTTRKGNARHTTPV